MVFVAGGTKECHFRELACTVVICHETKMTLLGLFQSKTLSDSKEPLHY